MALNIKNEAVEALATEVAALTGETKTEAVRRSLEERRARLRAHPHRRNAARIQAFLEREIDPLIPVEARRPITKAEREEMLGYGPDGV